MFARCWKARALWVGALSGLLLSPTLPVRAAEREQDGRSWFDAGVKSYQEGNYAAAIAAFQEAHRLTQRQGLLFSIAQALRCSYEKTRDPEQLREAIRYYVRYLSSNPEGDHRAEAGSWIEQLQQLPEAKGWQATPHPAEARAQLVIAANVDSAQLTLDGQSIPTLPHAAEVTPGKHRILVTAAGYAPYQRDLEVRQGTVLPINVALHQFESQVEVVGNAGAEVLIDGTRVGSLPARAFQLPPGRHTIEVREAGHYTVERTVQVSGGEPHRLRLVGGPTARRTFSWVLIGAGAAATAAGGVLGYFALQKQADAHALQDQPGMGPAFEDALAARNGLRLAAGLSAGLGVLVALGGTVSVLTEGSGPPHAAPAASSGKALRYHVSPFGVGLSGAF